MPSYPVFRLGRPKDEAALTHGIRWDERIATAAATATATATATAVDEAAQLAAWQSQVDPDSIANMDSVLPSAPTDDAGQVPFAHLLWPITHWAWTTLEAHIDPACLIRVNSKARDDLRRAPRASDLASRGRGMGR